MVKIVFHTIFTCLFTFLMFIYSAGRNYCFHSYNLTVDILTVAMETWV